MHHVVNYNFGEHQKLHCCALILSIARTIYGSDIKYSLLFESMIGNPLGDADALEAIVTIKAITTEWLQLTINQFVNWLLAWKNYANN